MELWIRSQDKEKLLKLNDIAIEQNMIIGYFDKNTEYEYLGQYKSKERALEVLDEIQSKIKTLLYLKCKALLRQEDIKAAKNYFEKLNNVDFVICDHKFEIEPITTNVIVYEMPKE